MHSQFKRPPIAVFRAGLFCLVTILVGVLAAGCSNLPFAPGKQGATEIKGPILSMLPASSIGDQGQPVNPRFTFPPTEPQITVIVQVGQVTGAPLNIVWYQVTDSGDQKLFEHQVVVQTNDRAFSIGKNASRILAAGTYKVIATTEGQTQEMEFDVTPQKATATGASSAATHGKPPTDGGTGKAPQRPGKPAAPSASGTDCVVDDSEFNLGPYPHADVIDVFVTGTCNGTDIPVEISATLNGEIITWTAAPGKPSQLNPCSFSQGSDLPGTTVHMTAFGLYQGQRIPGTYNHGVGDITLGDDTLAPRLEWNSPAKGSKVKEGEKINIKVTANEKRSGGPWQMGVALIFVRDEDAKIEIDSKDYAAYRGKSCDAKSWKQTFTTKAYTIPRNPPPIIHLCAYAEDFNNNQGSDCGEFPTGNTWKGKMHAVSTNVSTGLGGGTCSNETWDADFRVTVGGNGEIQGKGSGHLVAPPQCGGGFPQTYVTGCAQSHATRLAFDVKGKFDGKQFQLQFIETDIDGQTCGLINYSLLNSGAPPPTLTVPVIAPGDAEGQVITSVPVRVGNSTGNGQHTITMLCEDCK